MLNNTLVFFHIFECEFKNDFETRQQQKVVQLRLVDTVKITPPGDSVQLQFSINMLTRRYYERLPSNKVGMFGVATDEDNSLSSQIMYFAHLDETKLSKHANSFFECVKIQQWVIADKVMRAINNREKAYDKKCLLQRGTIQNDTLCWMHSVINGLLRGAYMGNELRCMVSKYRQSLSETKKDDKGNNVCPKIDDKVDKNAVLEIISKLLKQDIIRTVHIKGLLKVLKIRTNPLYVVPGWYADLALQKILKALEIPFYATTDHVTLLDGKEKTTVVDANVIVVHAGAVRTGFKPKNNIPISIRLAGKLYYLDHACVVLKNDVPVFSHFLAAILPKPDCFEEGIMYGADTDDVIPFNWMNLKEDTTLLNTYGSLPGGPVTSYDISYVLYVSKEVFSCEIDSASIKFGGGTAWRSTGRRIMHDGAMRAVYMRGKDSAIKRMVARVDKTRYASYVRIKS
jgi:hypothetical protein